MTQSYEVVEEFAAKEAISGRVHRFRPGDSVTTELGQDGDTIVVELDSTFFLVERPIFKACCKFQSAGGSAYF